MLPINSSAQFLKDVVEPDYYEAIGSPLSVRHAYHLAIGLFSLRDWVLLDFSSQPRWPFARNKTRFQKELEALCPDFSIISDVATSAQDLRLQKMDAGMRGAHQVTIYLGSGLSASMPSGANPMGAAPAITLDASNDRLPLLHAGEQVFFMWKSLFREHGWR